MMKHENIMNYCKLFRQKLTTKILDEELIELCPIFIENEATYSTECNHKYCITCLSHIKKCGLCCKVLQRSLICTEICCKVNGNNDTNIYSFQLRPENYQPSGTANFMRIYSTNYIMLAGLNGIAYSN